MKNRSWHTRKPGPCTLDLTIKIMVFNLESFTMRQLILSIFSQHGCELI